jgi:CheY-like chemotaxis protein
MGGASVLSRGKVFRGQLRWRTMAGAARKQSEMRRDVSEQPRFGGHLRYILVVDPDVNERFTMSMLVQRFGYTVCGAGSAAEAVEYLCVAPAVAVFVEAGETGWDLLVRLSGDARFREVPIVLVADAADRGVEERLQRGELAAVVRSPLDADEVFEVIQKVIERGSRRNIRIATTLPAFLRDEAGATEGYVTVLSQYGLFFRTLDPRPVQSRAEVILAFWDRSITLEATVLYVISFEEGPFREPGMGMKFAKISAGDSALVKAYILEQIGEGLFPFDMDRSYRAGEA